MIALPGLTPAAAQGWALMLQLHLAFPTTCTLIGGQLTRLLAAEHGSELGRPTDDIDVLVNVRVQPGGTRAVASWLEIEGEFTAEIPSADGIGHRFTKAAEPGPGRVVFDVLGPEGLGERTDLSTNPGARTVQVPGSVPALARTSLVAVEVSDVRGARASGSVRRPDLLGALALKAAATTEIAVRSNRERDWQDAALLLTLVTDPLDFAEQVLQPERRRLRHLAPLFDRGHVGWAGRSAAEVEDGIVVLRTVLE